jgi:hypothetical protein
MKSASLEKIIGRAKEDPKFFHALVFNPSSLAEELRELDDEARDLIFKARPGKNIGRLIGQAAGDCSCTSGTCEGTCGGSTCGVTCSGDSCGRTCDDSCGHTTDFQFRDTIRERFF